MISRGLLPWRYLRHARCVNVSICNRRALHSNGSAAKVVMVAATREHTGKTSVSLTLLAGLIARYGVDRVGYMKPVGQKWVLATDDDGQSVRVDKDVKVAKEHWGLTCSYRDMSPIILDRGYTKRYLDGEVDATVQTALISAAFDRLSADKDVIIIEGTGHTGVGSIVGCNNAAVAALLGVDIVLVANGGLGSTYDELEVNRQLCAAYGVRVSGIIINKVRPDKLAATQKYLSLALKSWHAPIIGMVPFADNLDVPSVRDLEILFGTQALSGRRHILRQFHRYELVTTSLRRFMENLSSGKARFSRSCFITHASRNDIILGLLSHAAENASADPPFEGGLVLTGSPPGNIPHSYVLDYVANSQLPVLTVGMSTTQAMKKMEGFTPKLSADDYDRTTSVVQHYKPHLDTDLLVTLMKPSTRSSSSSSSDSSVIHSSQEQQL